MIMTHRERIENYAFNIAKPFTAMEACVACGIGQKYCQKLLQEMKNDGVLSIQNVKNCRFYYIYNEKKSKPGKQKKEPGKNWISRSTLIIFRALYMQKEREMIQWLHENKDLYYA